MKKIAEFAIRFRWLIIVLFLGAVVYMGIQMKNGTFNADMMTYLPDDMEARVDQREIENIFGGTQMVMVVLETDDVINASTLESVKHFSMEMKKIKGIEKVMSVFETKQVLSKNDAMLVSPAVSMIPHNANEIEKVKQEIKDNDLVYGSIVSKDFTTMAIIGLLTPDASDKGVIEPLEKLITAYKGNEKVMLGGSPYLRVENGSNMSRDIGRLLPLGLLFMLVFLFVSFRQFRGVWLPTLVVIISIVISLGFIPLLGWDFTIVTIILPVLLIAVANDYGIHMVSHYQDDNYTGNTFSKKEISMRMVTSLGKPIVIAGLTTMAGMLCMLGHILIPAWQMGILATIGIAVALLSSILLVPAISSLLPKPKPIATPANTEGNKGLVNKLLITIGNLVTREPKAVIIILTGLILVFGVGISKLSVNTNPAKLYPEGHPARESSILINDKLGGFMPLSIVFEGDIKDPDLLKKIEETEQKIKAMPEVGTTQSIAKVTKQISRALFNKGEIAYDKMPDSYEAISQYFELYMMSGDPDDLEKMVDFDFEKAMILVRFKDMNTPVMRRCIKEIEEIVADIPEVKYIGGNADIFSSMDKHIVDGQIKSIIMSLIAVLIIITLAFGARSIKGAVLLIVPLLMAIIIMFGMMGFTGIELNFTTALLSSIMIGVGVDYTIHLVWRYREERRNGLANEEAMKKTIHTSGRGIILNAISVTIGFAALIFSAFLSVRFFGILMVVIILVCLIGGLLMIPSLCMILKPKFLEPTKKTEYKSLSYKKMKTFILLLSVLCLSSLNFAVSAQDLTAKQIQEKSIEATRVKGSEALSTLTIVSKKGQKRVRKMSMVTKLYDNRDTEKKLAKFTEPADVKGTGFLTFDYKNKADDKWIYMPALRKTRRIISSENAKSFMGSEFSYADMSVPTIEDFTYKFLTPETFNGELCYVIELTPKNDKIASENGFSKKISYISKKDFVIRKAIYYNLSGEKEKVLTVSSVIEVDKTNHKYKMKEMKMVNLLNSRQSISTINKIQFNPNVSDEYFSTRQLEK